MKCFAAVALVVGLIALPACAQRASSHGGGSGHAAPASRGGFAASAPSRSSGYRGFTAGRSPGIARGYQSRGYQARGYQGDTAGNRNPRSPYTGDLRYRRPYESPYRAGIPYVVPGYGWGPYFPGYPDYGGYDDSAATPGGNASDDASGGYDAEPPDQGQLGPYQPTFDMTRPAPVPPSEEAVTLIFKDGRPPEQIHNYVLTRTTLYVGDQHHRAIPTDQLDLVATAKVNQDAGVEFQLPNPPR